jgi:hypothetical protein
MHAHDFSKCLKAISDETFLKIRISQKFISRVHCCHQKKRGKNWISQSFNSQFWQMALNNYITFEIFRKKLIL